MIRTDRNGNKTFTPDNFPGGKDWEWGEGENEPYKQVKRVIDEYGDKIVRKVYDMSDAIMIEFIEAVLKRANDEGIVDDEDLKKELGGLRDIAIWLTEELKELLEAGKGWDDGSADWSDYLEKESEARDDST